MNESIRYLVELLDVLLGDCSGIAAGADVLESVFGELFKCAFGDVYGAESLRNAKVERKLLNCAYCRFCTFFNGQAIDIYTHCACKQNRRKAQSARSECFRICFCNDLFCPQGEKGGSQSGRKRAFAVSASPKRFLAVFCRRESANRMKLFLTFVHTNCRIWRKS